MRFQLAGSRNSKVSVGSIVAATLQYSGGDSTAAISVAAVMRAPPISAPDKASQATGVRATVGLGVGVLDAVAVGVRLGGDKVLVALTAAVLVTTRSGGVFPDEFEPPPQAASTTASIATRRFIASQKTYHQEHHVHQAEFPW